MKRTIGHVLGICEYTSRKRYSSTELSTETWNPRSENTLSYPAKFNVTESAN